MNILDYIILIVFAVCTIVGLFKGFIKQVLAILGVFVVATLTATVAPWVSSWLPSSIGADSRPVVAMIAAAIIIALVYAVLALLVKKLLHNISLVKVLDRILGAVVGFVMVYMIFAVIFALFTVTSDNFLVATKKLLGETFANSWFGQNIYQNNFFGDWIIRDIAQNLLNNLQPAA